MQHKNLFSAAFAVFLTLFVSFMASAQESVYPAFSKPETPKNILKTGPLAFLHGQMPFTVESRLGYERVIGKRSSVTGSYSHLGSNPAFGFIGSAALSATITTALTLYGKPGKTGIVWTETKIRTSGYRYQFQYKHYLGKEATAPEGFYVSPHYSYSETDYDVEMEDLEVKMDLKTTNRNYNLLFGYQAVLGKHLAMEVFTGMGYRSKNTKAYDANGNFIETFEKSSPLKISSGFNLGWAF